MMKVFSEGSLSVYADYEPRFSDPHSNSVVMRCWKKTASELEAVLAHLCDVKNVFSFDRLILSIDRDLDGGQTLTELGKVCKPFPVIPIQVSGPQTVKNWTRLLNAPLSYLYRGGVRDGLIFNLTFEAQIDLPSFESAIRHLDGSPAPCVSIRRTPEHLLSGHEAHFLRNPDRNSLREVFRQLGLYINGDTDDVAYLGLLKFLCRNTAMIWRFSDLTDCGGFDPATNTTGGQEEVAFLCRQLWGHSNAADVVVNYDSTFWYDDPRLSGDAEPQRKKLQAEQESILSIVNRYRLALPIPESDFTF